MHDTDYISSFLEPADLYDYCWETLRIPRLRDYNKRATRNSDYPVKPLHEHPLQTRFKRNETDRYKKWLHTTYPLGSMVDWIQFEFDRHAATYNDLWTPEEYADAEGDFYKQVKLIDDLADDQGFHILWTTSPGDRMTQGICAGKHVQGLYAWIFFDRPVAVMQLLGWTAALKEFHGIEVESSWDNLNQLIRVPGQRYVELCNPYSMKPVHEYDDEHPDAPLHQFNTAMADIVPAKVSRLLGDPVRWKNGQRSTVTVASVEQATSSPRTPKRMLLPNSSEHLSGCRSNPDTWDRIWNQDRTAQLLALKYAGDKTFLDRTVIEFERRVRSISPSSSETASDSKRLRALAKRVVEYAFDTFDPSLTRTSKRGQEDQERFSYCSGLDRAKFKWFVQGRCQVSGKLLDQVLSFFDYVSDHSGRVSYKVCHVIFGGKRAWDRMQKLLRERGILVTLDRYRKHDKCRQYGWSAMVVAEARPSASQGDPDIAPSPHVVSISCSPPPSPKSSETTNAVFSTTASANRLSWSARRQE